MEHNKDDIAALGAKLDALELTSGERSVMDAILAREDDTVGHGDNGFGVKIGGLLAEITSSKPNLDGAGSYVEDGPIVAGGPISGTDLGSGR